MNYQRRRRPSMGSMVMAAFNLIFGAYFAYQGTTTDDAGWAAVFNFIALANLGLFFINAIFARLAVRHGWI